MANIKDRRTRIKKGIRKNLEGTSEKTRLSILSSNKVIYAQIIDNSKKNTITASSSVELDKKGGVNIAISKNVGKKVAEKAIASGVERDPGATHTARSPLRASSSTKTFAHSRLRLGASIAHS